MPKRNQSKQSGSYAPGPTSMFGFVENNGEENVLMGHPEVAAQYTMRWNNRDPQLGCKPERQDLDYVSPARMNMRSKYGTH